MWKPIVASVPENFPVYTVGLPGHVAPYEAISETGMDQMAGDLSRALNDIGQGPFHFVGHSMGGYLAASLSQVNPDILASLCLFHSTAQADSREKQRHRDRAIEAIAYNKALFCKSMMASLFTAEHTESLSPAIGQALENALRIEEDTLIHLMLAMRNRQDSLQDLTLLEIPKGYITGDSDSRFPLEEQRAEAEKARAVQFSVLKNAAHMAHLEQPEATLKAFAEWFEKIRA
jgi:pimeloyl-ACP methyl ester carboxylesterase